MMADTEQDKLVQDANSNLVCSGYLSDHDSMSRSESPVTEREYEKDEVVVEETASPSASPKTPTSQVGAPIQTPTARPKQTPPMSADGLTHNELVLLERAYHESPYPSYQQLGKKLGITPFKVKCWFRKRRRNLHQESGAEMSVEEETRVFKQFIDDHAAGRTIPSIMLPSIGRHMNHPVSMVLGPSTSSENGGLDSENGGPKSHGGHHPLIAIPNPLAVQQMAVAGGKRSREVLKEPKVATVRPSKSKAKKPRLEPAPPKQTMPIMQPVFPGLHPPGLVPVSQHVAVHNHAKPSASVSKQHLNKNQMPDTTTSVSVKREMTTPSPSPSPAPSTISDHAPSPEQTPLFFKNPQISELMQEREYLGRLLHDQQMQALETRKKLIDVDRELARVSAQLQAQFPYQTPENWAFMAAAHPQMMMIAQAQQQLLHAQSLAAMETQSHYLNQGQGPFIGQGQGQNLFPGQGQGQESRSGCSTPEPDGQTLLPNTDYGLSRPESDESCNS